MKSLLQFLFTAFGILLFFSTSVHAADPLFVNSIVSTSFDFIRDSDPTVLKSVKYIEFSRQEMPDSRHDTLFAKAYIFKAGFHDSTKVMIWAHEDFGSREAAEAYVNVLANALGQQPRFNRKDLDHVILHKGDAGAYAEEAGKFFVIYSDNMDARISSHDLQETVFHECAHVALETAHSKAPGWLKAQTSDAGFITEYAAAHPEKEDVPESALFAFVLLQHPGRLPLEVEAAVRNQIPGRIAYFRGLPGFSVP